MSISTGWLSISNCETLISSVSPYHIITFEERFEKLQYGCSNKISAIEEMSSLEIHYIQSSNK